MRAETGQWLRFAKEDLANAQVLLAGERWAAASFHAQPAAEKALNALWVEREGGEPPRTHDLVRLAEDVGLPVQWLEDLDRLSHVCVVTRYPGVALGGEPPYDVDKANAKAHLDLAEAVESWARQRLLMESSNA